MKKILLVAAVKEELAPFLKKTGAAPDRWNTLGTHNVWVAFTGVGPVAAAFHIHRLVGELSPDLVVQAGIAGAYAGNGLEVGATVQVSRERLADLCIVVEGSYSDEFSTNEAIDNPHLFPALPFPKAAGFTVSTGCSPLFPEWLALYAADAAAVETMEGYSLFYVCRQLCVPFLQLRTVSNTVAPERGSWDLPLAFGRLAEALAKALEIV